MIRFAASVPAVLFHVRRIARQIRPDIMYVNTLMFPQAYFAGRLFGIPTIVHVREVETTYPTWVYRSYLRLAAKCARRLVAVAEFVANQASFQAVRGLADRCDVIYNSSELPLLLEREDASGILRVLCVMPLLKQKGALDLPDTVSALEKHVGHLPYQIDVVGRLGDAALLQRIEAELQQRGCRDRVEFHGPSDNIATFYTMADVLLQLSHTEAFPRTLVEAANAGLPAVVTAVGGSAEIIDDGVTGFLCKPGDAEGLAVRLAELLSDATRRDRMSDAARMKYESSYRRHQMIERINRVMSAALQRQGADNAGE